MKAGTLLVGKNEGVGDMRAMLKVRDWFARRAAHLHSDSGATAVEYALLVALIALVIVVGVGLFGTAVNDFFTDLATEIGTWL